MLDPLVFRVMFVQHPLIRSLCLQAFCLCACHADEASVPASKNVAPVTESTWKISYGEVTAPTLVSGRIVAEVPGSAVLVEERNGKQHQIQVRQIQTREETAEPFLRFTSAELAADLLKQVPAGFEIAETEHYVICSNSATEYVDYTAKLLELVFEQYFRFMKDQKVEVTTPPGKLPIVIFASASEFQAFAAQQHPTISFDDTPGYFSITDNQTLLLDLTGDRSIRSAAAIRKRLSEKPLQVATVVHEAVHQLAFNSGLQIRMADNPLWLSEGLAMYFETTSSKSSMLWSRPGLVNPRHQPAFVKLVNGNSVSGGMNGLIESDSAFLNAAEMGDAYAKSWALTHFLLREEKVGMQKFFDGVAKRKPMVGMTPAERIEEFQKAFGKMPDEMERELVSFMKRQRVSR